MQPRLPDYLLAKATELCGPSCGPARVKLILKNGRTIYDVFIRKGGEIVMANGIPVFGERDLRFRPSDIIDVVAY
jgi:hypothetical protein